MIWFIIERKAKDPDQVWKTRPITILVGSVGQFRKRGRPPPRPHCRMMRQERGVSEREAQAAPPPPPLSVDGAFLTSLTWDINGHR